MQKLVFSATAASVWMLRNTVVMLLHLSVPLTGHRTYMLTRKTSLPNFSQISPKFPKVVSLCSAIYHPSSPSHPFPPPPQHKSNGLSQTAVLLVVPRYTLEQASADNFRMCSARLYTMLWCSCRELQWHIHSSVN